MQLQRCPNCREKNDVSFYVHGQQARCTRCGIRFKVDHEALSDPNEARKATPKPPPPPPTPEQATHISSAPDSAISEIVVSSPDLPSALPAPAKQAITSGQLFPTPIQRPRPPPPRPPEPPNASVPPNIPGYDCLELLGRGGMGEVWRARQHSLNRIVAVKILAPTLAVEPDFVRRFERESTALAAIAHPNIVTVYDRGSANGFWYFVMEFVEGRSLRDRMEARLPRTDLLRLFIQVARAVDYAHKRGVIHRDLKPENVLLDHANLAKVADFGLAGMSEVGRSSLTMTAVAMGTAHYMAPEQRRDAKNVDGRADIYSLGVMLYELLCREIPAGKFPTPKEKVPDLDPRLDALVMQMLDQDPERRPAKASDLVDVVEAVLAAPPPPPPQPIEVVRPPPPQPTPPAKPLASFLQRLRQNPSQRMMLYGAGGLLLLILVVTIARAGGSGSRLLAAHIERISGGHAATIAFGSGPEDAVATGASGWKTKEGALVREASAVTKEDARAYIQRLPFDFDSAAFEADVEVEGSGSAKEPAIAELAFVKDEHQVALRLALGEEAVPSLAYYTPAKAKLTRVEGTHDRLQSDHKYHLELWVMNGKATAMIDKHQVASAIVNGLSGLKAKAGFGCEIARCRFSNVRVNGTLTDTAVGATGSNERE
jgi:serine/threonine-protein kinase